MTVILEVVVFINEAAKIKEVLCFVWRCGIFALFSSSRWLSREKFVKRVFELRREEAIFLSKEVDKYSTDF